MYWGLTKWQTLNALLRKPAIASKRRVYCYSSQKDQATCPHLSDGARIQTSRLASSVECKILHLCSSSESGQAKFIQQCLSYRVYLPSVDDCYPCHLGLSPSGVPWRHRGWRLDFSSWGPGRDLRGEIYVLCLERMMSVQCVRSQIEHGCWGHTESTVWVAVVVGEVEMVRHAGGERLGNQVITGRVGAGAVATLALRETLRLMEDEAGGRGRGASMPQFNVR